MDIENEEQLKVAESKMVDLANFIIDSYSNEKEKADPILFNAMIGGFLRRMGFCHDEIGIYLKNRSKTNNE